MHRRAFLAIAVAAMVSTRAFATAQIPEVITFDGRTEMLFSEPLNQYLVQHNNLAALEKHLSKDQCTGSWRGYRGTWEIRKARLYLTSLATDPCSTNPTQVPLSSLFFATPEPVFAKWYTGTLVVPTGKQVKGVHMGYQSQYEWYIVFTVSEGVVIGRSESSAQPK